MKAFITVIFAILVVGLGYVIYNVILSDKLGVNIVGKEGQVFKEYISDDSRITPELITYKENKVAGFTLLLNAKISEEELDYLIEPSQILRVSCEGDFENVMSNNEINNFKFEGSGGKSLCYKQENMSRSSYSDVNIYYRYFTDSSDLNVILKSN